MPRFELWEFSFTGMRRRAPYRLDLAPANSQKLIKLHSFIETLRLQSLVSCLHVEATVKFTR